MIIVRTATKNDLHACVSLGKHFWDATAYKDWFPYNASSVKTMCETLIENNMMLVVADDNEVVGVAGGHVSPWPFNLNVLAGCELFWYVKPEYRNGGIGLQMLQKLEQLARDAGANIWSMICLDALEPDKASKMYRKAGYMPTERTFTKVF